MPRLNRRFFLQLTGAAGLAPAIPALPARAAVAAPAGATTSQMLWASLHAQAGTAPKLARVAQSFGLSAKAATGICAKVTGVHLAAASTAKASQTATKALQPRATKSLGNITRRIDLRKWLTEDEPEDIQQDQNVPTDRDEDA